MTLLLQGAGIQALAAASSAPLFSSAEIGTVNASTVAVTFDQDVSAADYSAGVTIKVNGAATSITSATRQSDHAVVYYIIPVLWHGSGDAVTWEYASGSGNIVAESDSAPLGNVSAQSATNNCEYAALLDLQADTLALSDGDPVSTWADQSGNSRNFTQTGDARPTKQTVDGYPAVRFDGINDWMDGGSGDWVDNLESFSSMSVSNYLVQGLSTMLAKIDNGSDAPGWYVNFFGAGILVQEAGGSNYLLRTIVGQPSGKLVLTAELISRALSTLYCDVNGGGTQNDNSSPPVSNYSSTDHLLMGRETNAADSGYLLADVLAQMLFAGAPNATNRAALEARLAARYGVTL